MLASPSSSPGGRLHISLAVLTVHIPAVTVIRHYMTLGPNVVKYNSHALNVGANFFFKNMIY